MAKINQIAYKYKAQKKYKTPQSVRQNIISFLIKSQQKGVVINEDSDSVVFSGVTPKKEDIQKHLKTHEFVLYLKTLKGKPVAVKVFGRNRNIDLRFRKVKGIKRVRNAYATLATTQNLVSHIDKDMEYVILPNEDQNDDEYTCMVAFPTKSPRIFPKVINAVLKASRVKGEYAYLMALNIMIKNIR